MSPSRTSQDPAAKDSRVGRHVNMGQRHSKQEPPAKANFIICGEPRCDGLPGLAPKFP